MSVHASEQGTWKQDMLKGWLFCEQKKQQALESLRGDSEHATGSTRACPLRRNHTGCLLFCPWWALLYEGKHGCKCHYPCSRRRCIRPIVDRLPTPKESPVTLAANGKLASIHSTSAPLHCAKKKKTNHTWDDKEDKRKLSGQLLSSHLSKSRLPRAARRMQNNS